jgi:hypothetical protein
LQVVHGFGPVGGFSVFVDFVAHIFLRILTG